MPLPGHSRSVMLLRTIAVLLWGFLTYTVIVSLAVFYHTSPTKVCTDLIPCLPSPVSPLMPTLLVFSSRAEEGHREHERSAAAGDEVRESLPRLQVDHQVDAQHPRENGAHLQQLPAPPQVGDRVLRDARQVRGPPLHGLQHRPRDGLREVLPRIRPVHHGRRRLGYPPLGRRGLRLRCSHACLSP